MPRWPSLIATLPVLAVGRRPGGGVAVAGRRPVPGGRCARRAAVAAGRGRRRPRRRWRVLVWALVRLLGLGLDQRPPPHPRAAGVAGVVDHPGAGRGPHLAVPAVLEHPHPGLAARRSARGSGADVEASTVLLIPKLTTVNDGAFLADDTLLGGYELGGGWLRVEQVKVGKHAFVGNSGMTAPGRRVPKRGLVAVLSAAPRRTKAKAGTSWLGSPPTELRRPVEAGDTSRTYHPPTRLRVARALVELCRLVAVFAHVALCPRRRAGHRAARPQRSWWLAAALTGLVLLARRRRRRSGWQRPPSGCSGRPRPGAATTRCGAPSSGATSWPTPSSRSWRRRGSPAAPPGPRCSTCGCARSGARIGQGRLVRDLLAAGARPGRAAGRRDRQPRLRGADAPVPRPQAPARPVTLRTGSTLGPNGVILPAAVLGRHATVGPVSLVMRGESVPDKTRWIGNPIGPWAEDDDE